jgi:hypothetical protein
MTMHVQLMEPSLEALVSEFLEREGAWIYYTLNFQNFLTDLLGCESRCRVAFEEGEVVGFMPAAMIDGFYGPVLNSLPFFGSNGGPVCSSPEARQALIQAFAADADTAAAATIIGNPLRNQDMSPFNHNVEDIRISMVTPLMPESPENDLWMSFDGSVRRNVKKAIKCGVTVSVENDMAPFLRDLHRQNMKVIGGVAKSDAFFNRYQQHFIAGRDSNLYIARIDREPIAALMLLQHAETVEYYVPAIAATHRSQQPLALAIHVAMCDARRRGFRHWNWGGTWTTQDGVYRFKKKWAAHEGKYRYFTKVNNTALFSATPDELLNAYPNFYTIPFGALKAPVLDKPDEVLHAT